MPEKILRKRKNAAVICELNPFHFGHRALFQKARESADGVVCILGGNFVQRGEPAILDKWARARLALDNGADLVVELPLPWACAGAETFAAGGVRLADALGTVGFLAFGSECADVRRLEQAARALLSPEFSARLAALPESGETFARRREAVLEEMLGPGVLPLLRSPNAILGIEYMKALLRQGSSIMPLAFPRQGAGHDRPGEGEGFRSAGELRERLLAGEDLAGLVPESTADLIREQKEMGRCPASLSYLERAILCRLKTMEPEELSRLPDVSEGLENRLYRAARRAGSLEELYGLVKSKRYTLARVRRLVLSAFLGLEKGLPTLPPYLRILGMNSAGARIIRESDPAIPLVFRRSDFCKLDETAQRLFQLECKADDLYTLACPVPPPCGRDFTEKLIVAQSGR